MFNGGYVGKILRVNLGTRQYRSETLNEQDALRFLGGRGLAALWYYRLQGANTKPLSHDNAVIFYTGPLTGTPLPSTTKFGLSTRSPETGLYLCTNSGGDFGPQLKAAGYDAIIIEGGASHPVYLHIVDGQVTFRDARPFVGLPTSKVRAGLLQDSGESKAAVLCTGPAAEQGVRFAIVQVDYGRAFGRGGAGAVLAAKNLKGIVVHGSAQIPLADVRCVDDLITVAIVLVVPELLDDAADARSLGVPADQARAHQFVDAEQIEFLAQPPMVTACRLLPPPEVLIEFLFRLPHRAVDAL